MLKKKSIIQKTIGVAQSTLLSRILGLVREALMLNYLSPGIITDAFITAFKIPNSLRKIFAEGALSASLVPTLVTLKKKHRDNKEINSLMSLSIAVFEGILLMLCLFIFFKAISVINLIAPGWHQVNIDCSAKNIASMSFFDVLLQCVSVLFGNSAEPLPAVAYTVLFLRILLPLIIFLSISALLASALQAVDHFFIPAFAQVIINGVFIIGLIVCTVYQLPVTYLCWFIVAGCFLSMLIHIVAYFNKGFGFSSITPDALKNLSTIFKKFLPCLLSMSIMEIHLFIDTSLGSFLPPGSISLIYYANRFMGIPLGVFAVAFSTILLPHFTHIGTYAPKRLSFYLIEAAKLIWWVTIPASFFLIFVSEKLFLTLSGKFSHDHIQQAGLILTAFVVGLFFFSLNKVLLNIYYALHNTAIPFYISLFITMFNLVISYYYLMPHFGAFGIALATTCAGIVQTFLFFLGLQYKFNIHLYGYHFICFALRSLVQFIIAATLFLICYHTLGLLILKAPSNIALNMFNTVIYWLWVGPLACGIAWFILATRKLFNINLYFLD